MIPLTLTHYTLTSSLGAGLDAHVDALRGRRSGLAPCAFETA
ncbi:MAG TPA: beta-ketoacyl-[acyl-carrier-protein] synthase II, partial [Burkholderiales bacterium]|nr:beta-ketoacyl-[acyl-carrier-protein] synthase II [Burkholderiales bacterium]